MNDRRHICSPRHFIKLALSKADDQQGLFRVERVSSPVMSIHGTAGGQNLTVEHYTAWQKAVIAVCGNYHRISMRRSRDLAQLAEKSNLPRSLLK
jgi:hypothetical protein